MGLMAQGIVLMVVGMLVVFGFLVLMVLAMQVSAAFFKQYEARRAEKEKQAAAKTDDLSEIAVVLAAIQAHSK